MFCGSTFYRLSNAIKKSQQSAFVGIDKKVFSYCIMIGVFSTKPSAIICM